MDYKSSYKKTHPDIGTINSLIIFLNFIIQIEKRKEEVQKIREKFPDRIPIVVEKA